MKNDISDVARSAIQSKKQGNQKRGSVGVCVGGGGAVGGGGVGQLDNFWHKESSL